MPRFFPLLLALALCAGCTSPRAASAPPGVRLSVQPAPIAPGDSLVLVLENASADPVGYNLCASGLERREAGAWRPVPSQRVCTMELRTLDPGGEARYTLPLPEGLPAGEYRAVTGVENLPRGERTGVASEPFRVG